jgi:hypothetical protein
MIGIGLFTLWNIENYSPIDWNNISVINLKVKIDTCG